MRSIIETVMMDIMFEIPSRTDIAKVTVTEETVKKQADPVLELIEKEA